MLVIVAGSHSVVHKPEFGRIFVLAAHHLNLFPQLQSVRRHQVGALQRAILWQRGFAHQFRAVPSCFHHFRTDTRWRVWFVPVRIEKRLPALISHHFDNGIFVILPRQLQPDRRVQQLVVALAIFRRAILRSVIPVVSTAHPPPPHSPPGPAPPRASAIPTRIARRIARGSLVGFLPRIVAFILIQFPRSQNGLPRFHPFYGRRRRRSGRYY